MSKLDALFHNWELRGTFTEDFSTRNIKSIARALAKFFHCMPPGQELIIARDRGPKSEELQHLLLQELIGAGQLMIDLGAVTTPLFFYAPHVLGFEYGIFVSTEEEVASIRIISGGRLAGREELLEILTLTEHSSALWALSSTPGRVHFESILVPYLRMLRQKFDFPHKPKIVIDCAHRPDAFFTSYIFSALGCEVVSLASDFFQEQLEQCEDRLEFAGKIVKEEAAKLGLQFSTQGEKLQILDEKGRLVPPPKLILLFAQEILKKHPKAKIVIGKEAPPSLSRRIKKLGGIVSNQEAPLPLQGEVQKGALLAADDGYFYFADDYYGYADAFYSACRLLDLLAARDKPLSKILPRLEGVKFG